MNILQVCSADVLGGGEVHVIELTAKLRERGHRVEVAGRRGGPLKVDYALPFRNAMDLATAFRLRRIVKNGGFDIAHGHVARDYPVLATALEGFRPTSLVLTRQLLFPVRKHPFYGRVDGWIVTTEQILRSIRRLSPRRVEIIPNWVDTSRMTYRPRPLGRPVTVGLLGQVSPHKGHDDAIEAIRQLGDGYRLSVGGEGREDYKRALGEAAAGLPVEFLGFVHAAAFMRDIDILVLPSWEEPFGIVVLEAMAAGVSVIATDSGGPPEILDWGNAGLLVPPRDPRAIAEAVRRLAGDDALRERLLVAARRRVELHYDIEAAVSKVEAFYARARNIRAQTGEGTHL
jgi:glycosyltransferase involved in cell wall biosynthesis